MAMAEENPLGNPTGISAFECLPSSVIADCILTRLPLPEAVRTSLLSREWRHRWKSIPRLDFSEHTFRSGYCRKLSQVIDRVLLFHVGPIREFILSNALSPCPDVDPWIWVLSRKDVKRVVLHFAGGKDTYRLPSCLFDCESLIWLNLSCCRLQLPPMFRGFRHLKSLVLRLNVCTGDEIGRLISGCPLLWDLTLERNVGFAELRIYAPNLTRFTFAGSFADLILENTPLLVYAKLDASIKADDDHGVAVRGATSNLVRLFTALPSIRGICIQFGFLKYLSVGDVPERLPAPLCHIRFLSLAIRLRDIKDTMVALCLLKSCPKLPVLHIHHTIGYKVDSPISWDFWESKGLGCSFDFLKIVFLSNISDDGAEMAFAKFILANTPVLQKLNIKLIKDVSDHAGRFKMVTKGLLSFPRASGEARIVLQE